MARRRRLDDPYEYGVRARKQESSGQLSLAERSWKQAIRTADKLPMEEYKSHLSQIKRKLKDSGDQLSDRSLELEAVVEAYHELLSIPFRTRFELASFYVRRNNLPEALEALRAALETGIDDECASTSSIGELEQRARDLKRELESIDGPSDAVAVFNQIFHKLDKNNDGFVDESELQEAKLDPTIDTRGQTLIRYLLHHYRDVMTASIDEFLWEWKGITREDVVEFEKQRRSSTS